MPHICPSDLLCVLFSTQALSVNDEWSERRAVALKVHSYVCLRPDVSVSCRMIKLIRLSFLMSSIVPHLVCLLLLAYESVSAHGNKTNACNFIIPAE